MSDVFRLLDFFSLPCPPFFLISSSLSLSLIAHTFSFPITEPRASSLPANATLDEKYLAAREQTSDLINKFVSLCLNIRIANFRKQLVPLWRFATANALAALSVPLAASLLLTFVPYSSLTSCRVFFPFASFDCYVRTARPEKLPSRSGAKYLISPCN